MRRRVLLLVGATTSLVLVAFLLPLALLIRDVAADRAVQAATVRAQSLSALVATTDAAALSLSVRQVDTDATVFLADGTTLGAAADRTSLVELAFHGTSASGDVPGGREIVFAVAGPTTTIGVIRTFVPDARLSAGVGRAWLLLIGLAVVLLAVSLVVADRLARSLVRATISLAAVSHRLARGDLDARADPAAPAEIGVVATALNGLAGRIADLLREERETIADLSHRVRTPLMALRLDAEALAGPDDAERIGSGVDAVQRAVTQVIEQARRRGVDPAGSSDAAEVVRERVAFWLVLAEDTDRRVGVDVPDGPLPVAVARADLEASVDALLGNVFAHTPDGTDFQVALWAGADGGARLVVADAGPGMDATAVRRGTSGSGSSGLGLDIVRRTAEQAGGGLRIGASERGGLLVTVDLGPPA
ncbi:ATP-binding protein [Umezawaea endophytica]|uniref:Signal transduction histidine-protein kinase/phosphatase MprB n=1 Tax=Umezawaea endophytica TaxID=1654476 RepID=A0A9X2VJ98_9PSEU|nr:HAMP domain-containing sensor histidine kinase [Umezawaea endophytica]MCS7477409.1 HAMP domain-containing histidine kinase [Umezawaea endophytica]